MMSVLVFDMIPAVQKKRTGIVETDKEDLRAPAKAVADMDRRSFTAGHPLRAVGTDMHFVKIIHFICTHRKQLLAIVWPQAFCPGQIKYRSSQQYT
jgi:hypothetical protein